MSPVAYVKFLEGSSKNKKVIVPVEKFRQKIDNSLTFDEKKKYFVQDDADDSKYVKAKIIFLEGTEDALNEKIKGTRPRLYPENKMETEESEHEPLTKFKKSYSDLHSESATKEKRLKKYASILHVDVNYLKSNLLNDNSVNTTPTDPLCDETNTREVFHNEIISLDKDNSSLIDITNNEANSIITKSGNKTDISDPKGTNVGKIASKAAHNEEIMYKKKILHSKAEMEKLKKKEKDNKMKIEKAEKKYEKVKEELKQLQKRYENTLELNQRLQIEILDKIKEREVINNQLYPSNSMAVEINTQDNFAPIGFYRKSDDTYHVGRNIRLSAPIWNRIILHTRTPFTCVGNIVTALFDEHTLSKSTITGKISNRSKSKKKKENVLEYERLDETKIGACEDFYLYWLKAIWMTRKKRTELEYACEASKFESYVSKKVSYFKLLDNNVKALTTTKSTVGDNTSSVSHQIDEEASEFIDLNIDINKGETSVTTVDGVSTKLIDYQAEDNASTSDEDGMVTDVSDNSNSNS